MATEREYQGFLNRLEALRARVADRLSADLAANPQLADAVTKQIDDMLAAWVNAEGEVVPPPDKGLAQLVGVGPEAATELGQTRVPPGVKPYDEAVTSERVIALADLYYIYQHEKIGIFRVVTKLQEVFRAGTVRLSDGPGAYALYQFDRRQVLRFTRRDRLAAYCRAFGYCAEPAPPGARPNTDFHRMYTNFVNKVAEFWRDRRISDVLRERAYDPSFGSIATVRRAGLDLRNNLKWASYGHLNVMRVEVMQLLDEAFRILGSADIKAQFGADNAWDVIEEVLTRYFGERLTTSPRQRMAVSGREVIRWLAQPHILQNTRTQFEALLIEIAEYAEEWLTSAESLGVARRWGGRRRTPPFDRPDRPERPARSEQMYETEQML